MQIRTIKLIRGKTVIALYMLTLFSTLPATYSYGPPGFVVMILGLSALKFLLVSFPFMEMKKAHVFWKILIAVYLTAFVVTVGWVLG